MTGKRFGRLVVIEQDGFEERTDGKRYARWKCKCDCGNTVSVRGTQLSYGTTKSCGCLHIDTAINNCKSRAVHNGRHTRLYNIWNKMKNRCRKTTDRAFKNYGGRGIDICDEWFESFIEFRSWSLSHGYSDNLTIDRIDNNKGYSPDNCRWTTYKTQGNNTRSNHYISMNGETHTVKEWCDKLCISYQGVLQRINKLGWSTDKALTTPIRKLNRGNTWKKKN